MEYLFVLVFVGLLSGVLTGYVADAKGYSMTGWFLVGCAIPLLGLIAAAGMPLKVDAETAEAVRRSRLKGTAQYITEVQAITQRPPQ